MQNKTTLKLIAIMLTIIACSLIAIIYLEANPCEEYKTSCHYGTRNLHQIDCNNEGGVPDGYTFHKETRCIRR